MAIKPTSDLSADVIKFVLVEKFGLPADWLVYKKVQVPALKDYSVTRASFLSVLNDFCKRFGMYLIEMPDATFQLVPDPWYARDEEGTEPEYTWDWDNSITSQLRTIPRPGIAQVEVTVRDPSQNKTQTFRFPETTDAPGRIETADEVIAPLDSGPWIAQREFSRLVASRSWRVEPVGLIDHVWGLQRHKIDWQDMEGLGIISQVEIKEGPADYSARIELRELKAT